MGVQSAMSIKVLFIFLLLASDAADVGRPTSLALGSLACHTAACVVTACLFFYSQRTISDCGRGVMMNCMYRRGRARRGEEEKRETLANSYSSFLIIYRATTRMNVQYTKKK